MLTLTLTLIMSASLHAALPIPQKKEDAAQIKDELKDKYKDWLKEAKLQDHQVSFSLINLQNLKTQDTYNQNTPFIPASITKVFTCYFALSQLGGDHEYKTYLYHDGKIEDGVLKGNLYLYGEGDPMLTHAKLFNFILSLKAMGIKKVEGKFIYDDSYFYKVKMISIIGLGDQTYNPSISALSSEFNRFTIWREEDEDDVFTPIPTIDSILITKTDSDFAPGRSYKYVEPIDVPQFKSKDGHKLVFGDENNGRANMEHWQLSENNHYRKIQDLPVRRPSLFTASFIRFMGKKMGIEIPYPQEGTVPSSKKLIGMTTSPTLDEIARLTLTYSNNFMAETLLLTAAKKMTGEKLDLKKSAEKMQQWFKTQFPTLDWDEVYLINGSGLTSANTVSASVLAEFLARIREKSFNGKHFWSLLSISGKTGWLKKRFPGPDLSYNIWAKTGSLDYVNNIAGYLFSKKGNMYAFSIFINDLDKRKIVDGDNSETVNRMRNKARGWKSANNSFHKHLLEHWVNSY